MTVSATLDDLPRIDRRPVGMDDHAYLRLCRSKGPLAIDRYGFVWVFSHADMLTCTDPTLTRQVETEKAQALGARDGPVFEYFANSLLFSNGRVHERRRRPLSKAFAFRVVAGFRPLIRQIVRDLIDACDGHSEVDFLNEFAARLPAQVIGGILGVPSQDIPHVAGLVDGAMRALSLRPSQMTEAAVEALAELDGYVTAVLAERRSAPQGDFLSGFARMAEQDGLTEIEARVQITSVILAGSDTMRMALCSTLAQLLQDQRQWEDLAADPDGLVVGAVAEGLRYDPVIGSLPRVAITDFDLQGVRIPADTVIAPVIVSILRDPEVYDQPDRFDIRRTDHPRYHPVFGAGVHRCLGEALARAELEEALIALAEWAPTLRLAGPPPILSGVSGARTIDQMAVSFG